MNKLLLGSLLATASCSLISLASAADTAPTRQFSQTEISYIQNINCDTFKGSDKTYCLAIKSQALAQASNTGSTTLPPPQAGSGAPLPPPPHHDEHTQSGNTLPKPPMSTSSGSVDGMRGVQEAIAQLSPTDREALAKIIRNYLTSKGITISDAKSIKQEVKEVKEQAKQEIKDTRDATKKAIQAKRDALKEVIKSKRDAHKEKRSITGTVAQ